MISKRLTISKRSSVNRNRNTVKLLIEAGSIILTVYCDNIVGL